MSDRRVAENTVGDYWISTVAQAPLDSVAGMIDTFLGVNRRNYETMVFPSVGGEVLSYLELHCERYDTVDEALEGHQRIVHLVEAGELPDPDYEWIGFEANQ